MTLPSGTVTFLFTDIEGSTKLAQQYPDEWEALRARHHEILQSAMDAHNGYVSQIIADAPIKVRMGIHTGKAEIQDDREYHGYLAMSRVQRLMSAAYGGQVLISLATEKLIRDELPKDVTLRDMGQHHLKDFVQTERIYQLDVPSAQIPPRYAE